MSVVVVDYGMGNIASVRRALEVCGADVVVSPDPAALSRSTHVILPGVGAFADGIARLRDRGWVSALREGVLQQGKPLLGICLGMQLLATRGFEGVASDGLNFVEGEVVRLRPDTASTKIPHVGWNETHVVDSSPLFRELPDGLDFYFVHSFHFVPADVLNVVATTPYCGRFVSALSKENVFGVQFHPEKSSHAGLKLLRNFLAF